MKFGLTEVRMVFKEIQGDLFTADKDAILVHCISQDCKMGAGIAKRFTEIGIKDELLMYRVNKTPWKNTGYVFVTRSDKCPWKVANLITKEKYYNKPTYDTLYEALCDLREMYDRLKYLHDDYKAHNMPLQVSVPTVIAMPRIGCGLDKLEWSRVKQIIIEVFEDTDLTIEVYYL